MLSEYNIQEHIYLTNTTYRIDAMFQHVQGHQDVQSKKELTMEENLNDLVEELAGQYQDK